MESVTISTLQELNVFAGKVLAPLSRKEKATVLALEGDLGVGKTAFTKEIAKHLGVTEEITSPTFVIMKLYHIPGNSHFKKLIHIDAYRIEEENEMRVLGFEALRKDPENLIVIEWPEHIRGLIPEDAHYLTFTLERTTRTITYGN